MEFVHPSTWLVSGPTGCGKTRFIINLLCDDQIKPAPTKIIWVYAEWQSMYSELAAKFGVACQFSEVFTEEMYKALTPNDNNVVVLDDQMLEGGPSARRKEGLAKDTLVRLFIQGSHHRSITVIYPVQNLFDKQKSHRTISINAQYMVIFRNPRDAGQIEFLGRQMSPNNPKFLSEVFQEATENPYSYLFLNFRSETPQFMRVMANVLKSDQDTAAKKHLSIYVPRTEKSKAKEELEKLQGSSGGGGGGGGGAPVADI